ncbi:NADPH dehydrogenase NamA [Priestia endophytica]|jgi:NADPH2 dehydrogenase|uniref:NADPH dehydrogenase n=1 Tax=Priestia endophytica DSM 13796 TaxID=1121089 RepID=A0A1I5WXG4_9BACI|nr:NADPH dehydrogenase NamA [Priestia endophytica]KAB2487404.1 NADPH dehydrogenase NamA [Priestia endophytica]KYG36342.1 NADPH dehydrogenase [Priestia endophytica]MBG9815279.1 NADPH dehydrogenase [Priestia endophytica]RAS86231.1 NADPH dehydrogenase NamA [Priestia endophytica]SFQ24380.1 NADPH2 dehydrogenase [Priestia endophytica DSM 13796]
MKTKLFSPYTVKGVTIKNRIVMSPMCMYSSDESGKVKNWHLTHYTTRAVGQVGLIIVEATAVSSEGRISPRDLGIWSDEHIDGLKNIVSLSKEHGAKVAIQLAHAGRKAELEEEILAPSAIAFDESYKTPKEMTKEDIQNTIQNFKEGARRAKESGFDIIEIHGAHGYLINEFLSPISNKREDEYGGSPQNRYRFLKEVIEAVKEEWNGPLFVRVSAFDYLEEGLKADDYVPFAKWMKEQGVDLIDVSSGAVAPAPITAYPGYQVQFADQIKNEANIDTGAVGLITNGFQAEEILRNNRADLVFLARELLRDPYWPRTAAKELREEIEAPVQYEYGW